MDETKEGPNPFLLSLFFFAIALIIASGILNWMNEKNAALKKNPFYQVTNREFAEFIRQNPRFLNENVSSKEAYLPGLKYMENISSEASTADDLVKAPDRVLFQYHTWKRLIDLPIFKRPIPLDQFKDFLKIYVEWTPKYWKAAPKNYVALIESIEKGSAPTNLEQTLPEQVQKAFIGWKNFTSEKDDLEKFSPLFLELLEFLKTYPTFSRNYWINLLQDSDPSYLKTVSFGKLDPKARVPDEEMAPFLEIALFNQLKSQTPPQKLVP